MHRGAECVDPAPGEPAPRAGAEPQLDRGLQKSGHYPPHDVLRKRGLNSCRFDLAMGFIRGIPPIHYSDSRNTWHPAIPTSN